MRVGDCKDELGGLLMEERLAGATLLVFANKQDLAGSMTLEEIRDALDLQSIVSHRWQIHSCSAYTGVGLQEGMDWVIREVAGRLYWSGLNPSPVQTRQGEGAAQLQVGGRDETAIDGVRLGSTSTSGQVEVS